MDEENIRKPDEPKREILLPNTTTQTIHENDDDGDSMKKALQNSMESYEKEYIKNCQEHVVEHDIQMMLQQEYDQIQKERDMREEILRELMIRLKIIDKDKKYIDVVSVYIETGIPMKYDLFIELIDFVKKPSLVSLIVENIKYENH